MTEVGDAARAFPLPMLLQHGERARVRGGHERRSKRLPLTPVPEARLRRDPLPVKRGEGVWPVTL